MNINLLSWIGNFLVLFGVLIIALGYPVIGSILGILSNICFIYFGIKTKYKAFIINSIILFVFNSISILNWGFYSGILFKEIF